MKSPKKKAIENIIQRNTQTTIRQTIARLALGLFMLSAGIAHLTYLKGEFHAQVPNWVPFDKDLVVVLSGWVEISFGAAMIFLSRYKIWVGIALALFLWPYFRGTSPNT